MVAKNRPVFLNLLAIKLPIGGLVSIMHRVTGVLWVMALPAVIFLLDLSLRDAEGYAQAVRILHSPLLWPFLLLLGYGLIHHLLAGLRVLALDVDVGVALPNARRSAYLVVGFGLASAVGLGVWLW